MRKLLVPFVESVRTVLLLSVQKNLQTHQMDVITAFLHEELSEEIFMKHYIESGEGYIVSALNFESGNEHLVCRLKKSRHLPTSA